MEYRAYKTGDETYRLDDPDETYDTSSWGRTFDGTMSPCRAGLHYLHNNLTFPLFKKTMIPPYWGNI